MLTTFCLTPNLSASRETPRSYAIAASNMSIELFIPPVYHFSDASEISHITKEFFGCDLLAGMSETIGTRLQRLRTADKLTQKALGGKVGMSQGGIGNIETGQRGYGDSVVALAGVLRTSPEYLLLKTDDPSPRLRPVRPGLPEAQAELKLQPVSDVSAFTPEAQLLAQWFDRLPAGSLVKMEVTQACLQLIVQALQPANPPSHTPAAAATAQKQSA